ncbi:MAG: mandelate racemase/muconate lactonizing enzyme family protein [Rhodospirillales bacterium]|jgi:L-alanine-DL-glutamate epimerase-like enolase superfamily enzyme
MKITEVRTHPMKVELNQPSWTAHEIGRNATLTLFEVRTDEGLVGYGEVQGGPQQTICDLAAKFNDCIKGMDPMGHVEIWERLFSTLSPRPGGLGGWDGLPSPLPRGQRPQAMAAIGGIDIALWDIKGKAAGLPVYKLLGGTKQRIFTYSTGGYYIEDEPLDACASEMAGFVEMGYQAVKMKTGALSLEDELIRIRTTREAIGPKTLLMLDMNASFGVEDCITFANAVAPYDIFWLEEPLHWHLQPDDYVRLASASPIPLAHGEREWTRFTIRDFINSGSLKYVQFDSTRHAGFTESLRIAHLAEQQGVLVAPHTAPQIHGHLVSAFGNAAFGAESHGGHDRHPIQHHLYINRPEVRDGMVHLNDLPGFGIDINWDYVEKVRC